MALFRVTQKAVQPIRLTGMTATDRNGDEAVFGVLLCGWVVVVGATSRKRTGGVVCCTMMMVVTRS